jgi:phospholipase/lecithinase/hemolysin
MIPVKKVAMRRFVCPFLTLALFSIAFVSLASAQTIQRIVFFGDSLSDSGNNYIFTGESTRRPFPLESTFSYDIGGHHYSNGATWAEQVSSALHLLNSGKPSLRHPGVFTNYAVGEARGRPGSPIFPNFDLTTQVAHFLSDFKGQAPANTLFVIWIGGTDIQDALNALSVDPSGATSTVILEDALAAIGTNIEALYGTGAREFLIVSVPDLGKTPLARYLGTHENPLIPLLASQLTGEFDLGLQAGTAPFAGLPGMKYFHFFEVNALLDQAIASPGSFGLTDVVDSCTVPFVMAHAICTDPGSYLFWDGTHPTTAGHAIVANAVLSLLPRQ